MSRPTVDPDHSSPADGASLIRAYRNGWAVGLFLVLAILAAGADLWTKHLAFERLLDNPSIEERVKSVFGGTPPADTTPQTTHQVLRHLHITHNVCFGLSFTLSTNPGVVFGVNWLPMWTVNLITIFMIVLVTVFFATSERRHYWLHVALALILGGAVGNLYDRLASSVSLPNLPPIRYHVRDFIDCSDLAYRWIFNVADAWLVIGVGMILVYWLWTGRKTRPAGPKRKGKRIRTSP